MVGPQIWNVSSGRVELCINNEWSSICNQSWDDNDAMVACKQMGLEYKSEYYAAMFHVNEYSPLFIKIQLKLHKTGILETLCEIPNIAHLSWISVP